MEETQNLSKILIVEDDMIIASDISMQLTRAGFQIIGICTSAEDALRIVEGQTPDIILMDIVLNGEMDGIQAAKILRDKYGMPVIFTTSNTDDSSFQQALDTQPYAFLAKPFRESELVRTIKIALRRKQVEPTPLDRSPSSSQKPKDHYSYMDDTLYIRYSGKLQKVRISDILYVEADRNYCKVQTISKKYLISAPLKSITTQLPSSKFTRVHRSYLVNFDQVDSISDHHEYLMVSNHQIPISRRMKENVINRINMI